MPFNNLLCLFGISVCFIAATVSREVIIGAERAKVDQFPYQVSVQSRSRNRYRMPHHVCGGGIIDNQFILTAAHCIYGHNGQFNKNPLSVLVGTNFASVTSELTMPINVKKAYVPMEYHPKSFNNTSDIAVLKLNQSLELTKNRHLKSMKLPTNRQANYDDKTAEIAGWGWDWIEINGENKTGGNNYIHLRFAEAHVISNDNCQEGYPRRKIYDKHVCAKVKQSHGPTKIRGVCEGDGGGPLVYHEVVIGILSENQKSCSEQTSAAIYTRTSRSLAFIDNAMKDTPSRYMRTFVYEK